MYDNLISYIHGVCVEFPQFILDVEKIELNISAGLQDRVVQWYGGLVHMDFSDMKVMGSNPTGGSIKVGVYTRLNEKLLPSLYIAYNTAAG